MTSPTAPTAESTSIALTPRQRLLRALRCQPADRVPVWIMRQAGRYLPEYNEVRRKYEFLTLCKTPEAAAEVSIQPLKAIGSDAVIIFNDILIPLEMAGAKVGFDDKGPILGNPLRCAEDLDRLQTREVSPDEPVARSIAEVRRRVGEEYPILGFVGAPWTLATYWVEGRLGGQFEAIGTMRYRDPALLEALLEQITEVITQYLKIQIQAGADAVQIFDTWGSALTQDEYARFSAPYIRKIIEAVKPLGAPVILYVNGCTPYIDQLRELGADALSIDWRLELRNARQTVGPKMALQGNLDPLVLLSGPEAVETAVRELFKKFPPGPGHVFNLGHGILPKTPVATAQRLIEAVKRYGAY